MKKIISLAIAAVMCAGLALSAGCSHTHEFGDWKLQKAPTCTQEGLERRDCKECEYSQSRTIPKSPHTAEIYAADENKHWKECTVCQQRFDEGPHTFSGSVCSACQYDKNGTSSLQYTLNSDKRSFTVTGVLGTAPENVTIPDRYIGYPVTCIASGAFEDQRAMKSIVLPKELTRIENRAFNDCPALQSLNIPASVKDIGTDAFIGCTALSSITVEKGNGYYSSADGILYDAPMTKFIHIPAKKGGELVIPETVVKIDVGVFSGNEFESVVIGGNVTQVAMGAFRSCKSLKTIEVKSAVTVFEKGAIVDCPAIEKLVLATTWQEGLSEPDPGKVPTDRASGDSYLGYIFGADLYIGTGLSLPAALKTVEFTGGDKLHNHTFSGCASLESVILPASLQAIEDNAFYGCTALKSVLINEENTKYLSKDGIVYKLDNGRVSGFQFVPNALAGEVTIPEGITVIASGTFNKSGESSKTEKCAIETLHLPASLKSIQGEAFKGCSTLKTLTLPEESGLTKIGDDAFSDCSRLGSIVIPASVTEIGERAFFNCTSLLRVEFKVVNGWTMWMKMQSGESVANEVSPDRIQDPAYAATFIQNNVVCRWTRSE